MGTLHHFTNPVWFTREGGWHRDAAVAEFARYVEAALPVLEDVQLVCTINEPNMVSVLADPEVGFPSIGLPPGVPAVTDRLIAAHRAAMDVVRSAGKSGGWSVATQAYQPQPGAEAVAPDRKSTRLNSKH